MSFDAAPSASHGRTPRCIGMKQKLRTRPSTVHWHAPILLNSCLHWQPDGCFHDKIVVFDTMCESFRLMSSPNVDKWTCLHEMEGTLGISCINDSRSVMKIWVRQDYRREVWSLKCQLELPTVQITSNTLTQYTFLSKKGDMLIRSGYPWDLLHCDSQGKLLEKIQWESWRASITGHWFKETLIRHAFFPRQGVGCVTQPRFLQRLSGEDKKVRQCS